MSFVNLLVILERANKHCIGGSSRQFGHLQAVIQHSSYKEGGPIKTFATIFTEQATRWHIDGHSVIMRNEFVIGCRF